MAKNFPKPPRQAHRSLPTRDRLLPLHLWHLTSLDAPTVAVVWTLGFAWAARVRLPGWVPLLVALVVWGVYVADRLLDARADLARGTSRRLRERHLFHWHHRRWLIPMAALAATTAGAILLGRVPVAVRERDSVLAAAALAYFTQVHAPQRLGPRGSAGKRLRGILTKELLVGLLFTAGCVLPAWSRTQAPAWSLAAPALAFALLAWLNCALIDAWESPAAERPQLRALTYALALALGAGSFAVGVGLGEIRIALLLDAAAVAALLLVVLNARSQRLRPLTLRALADLVLLTPLLAFALGAGLGR